MSEGMSDLEERLHRLEERLDRVESVQAIERLAHRYTLAADSRDLEGLIGLFVDDVECGRFGTGRDALRESYEVVHRQFYRTVHHVTGHTIEFESTERATGTVTMRAEHEVGDRWVVATLCLFDTYARRDDQWYFVRRKPESWYSVNEGDTPSGPTWTAAGWGGRTPRLPGLFPTWHEFWDRRPERVGELTDHPAAPI
jgi:hypothetical protein